MGVNEAFNIRHNIRKVEIRRGLEGYKWPWEDDISAESGTVLHKAVLEILGDRGTATEYLVRKIIPLDAVFPYRVDFEWEEDINGVDLPINITNAFVTDLQAIDLERVVILVDYDRKGFNFRLGRYGQPIKADWVLQFTVKGGY